MRATALIFSVAVLMATGALADEMPSGSFTCQRLMTADFAKAGPGDFLPSVLGSFTLDGKGGYVHPTGKGTFAISKDMIRFMDGPMKGVIAVPRTNAKGKLYLHIDQNIIEMPKAQPVALDVVCAQG